MLSVISSVRGIRWPAVPGPRASQLLALQCQLEQSQWYTPDEMERQQARQLGALLEHAYESTPFYRQRLDNSGLPPRRITTAEDWRRIPLLTRLDLQTAGTNIQSTAVPKEHGGLGQIVTSGSTGKPVMVRTTGITQHFWHAFTLRDHLWHRRDFSGKLASIRFTSADTCQLPDGRVGTNWGPATKDIVQTGPSATLHINCSIEEQAKWLLRQDPEYLLTYPSNVHSLARHMEESGMRLTRLREVRTFGELLEPHVRAACREAWNVEVVDMYSSQEVGYIALQCPRSEHYHAQSENVLVEVLDPTGNPCGPGQVGRVVLTALHNFATPLLRYDIGDFAEVGEPCVCGRGLLVLKRIMGRQRNMLILPNGEQRWPSIQVEDSPAGMEELPPVLQFQVIQRTLHDVEALLVVARPFTERELETVKAWLLRGLGYPFHVTFTYVDKIPSSPTGKYEDFKSEVAAAMTRSSHDAQ